MDAACDWSGCAPKSWGDGRFATLAFAEAPDGGARTGPRSRIGNGTGALQLMARAGSDSRDRRCAGRFGQEQLVIKATVEVTHAVVPIDQRLQYLAGIPFGA